MLSIPLGPNSKKFATLRNTVQAPALQASIRRLVFFACGCRPRSQGSVEFLVRVEETQESVRKLAGALDHALSLKLASSAGALTSCAPDASIAWLSSNFLASLDSFRSAQMNSSVRFMRLGS